MKRLMVAYHQVTVTIPDKLLLSDKIDVMGMILHYIAINAFEL